MSKGMVQQTESSTIAHMQMIQGIVNRLEGNAFTLKALAMTLAAAVLAFMGALDKLNWVYPIAGCLPVFVFWVMDAHYLKLGRQFRCLFNAVRKGQVNEPFSMNFQPYAKEVQSTLRIAFSWSVMWFYLSIVVSFAVISFITYCNGV